jgi:hypothetical protein
MKSLELDAEARLAASIFVGEVIIFALGAWHYAF